MKPHRKRPLNPGSGRPERYLQPTILMGLYLKPSYGYELIHTIGEFGFVEGQAPPGMIYRHLRQLEQDGLVVSQWETEGSGPAKRMYALTEEGVEVLGLWIEYLEAMAGKLQGFIDRFQKVRISSEK